MSLHHLLVAAAVAVTPVAAAADWYRVAGSDKATWYIDAGSMTRSGKWTRVNEFALYNAVSAETGVKTVKLKTDYDCAARTFRNVHILAQGPNGEVKLDLDQGEGAPVETVSTGTIIGSAFEFACGDRSRGTRVPDPTGGM